jgi:Ca-activated chloride channel family protein
LQFKEKQKTPYRYLFALKLVSLIMMVLALARPQNSYKQTERQVSGVDIMMVMDVSASMLIEDMGERNRLEIAKDTMTAFIKGRENDRIGFVIFSGEPLTLSPPTLDYGLVLSEVKKIETGVLKDGTAIGDGLSLATNRLRNSQSKSRVIILLTDGDSNVGQVDPATAGDIAAGYGIKVYTIAIGKEGRFKIPIKQKGLFGNTVTTYQWMDNTINTKLLEQIAEQTHGRFYRVEEEGALDSVFKEISKLEKTEIKVNEKTQYEEMFQKPLKFGAFLLILEKVASRFLWRMIP